MMKSLEGENEMSTCVITGIGSGIGRAVAIELSKRAYYNHYALLGRNIDAIEDTIKDIFSNKNDIAIQNILHELDEEQLKAITNNHEIDISPKSSSPSLDDGGCCPYNICNCNLDRLNCFSGIFNSKS